MSVIEPYNIPHRNPIARTYFCMRLIININHFQEIFISNSKFENNQKGYHCAEKLKFLKFRNFCTTYNKKQKIIKNNLHFRTCAKN